MQFLTDLLGGLFRYIYETLVSLGAETSSISNLAMAFIIMAVVYKLLTIPLTIQQTKATKKTAELQPKIDEIKKKYGYDQQILNQKLQEFQKENNVATAGCSGCLVMILQLVIVFALYNVVQYPGYYLFDNPEKIQQIARNFFWIEDLALSDKTGFVLAALNSLTQMGVSYLSQGTMGAQTEQAQQTQKMMMYGLPLIFFFIFRNMPAGLVLYWIVGNIIEIAVRSVGKIITIKK